MSIEFQMPLQNVSMGVLLADKKSSQEHQVSFWRFVLDSPSDFHFTPDMRSVKLGPAPADAPRCLHRETQRALGSKTSPVECERTPHHVSK